MKGLRGRGIPALALMAALLLLSALLVWHDLGAREVLGRDENATITKLDQPSLTAVLDVTYMKVTGEPGNMQPLYFLLQYLFWPVVQRSAFMLRFLPSVLGLLTVVMVYKLGEALWDRRVGLAGALLAALIPIEVEYAQIARPYTLLALLSLASAYFLVQSLKRDRPIYWAGFVVTAALNFYTHFNALFVLAAEGLFAGTVCLVMLIRGMGKGQQLRWWLGPLSALLALGLLCLPGIVRLARLPWAGSGGAVVVELTVPFFLRYLYKIGLTTPWLRGLVLGLMGLGLMAALYHRHDHAPQRRPGKSATDALGSQASVGSGWWWEAWLVILWLTIPFVTLAVMKSPRPFHERYLIFVPPVALLLAGRGAIAIGEATHMLGRSRDTRGVQWLPSIAITAVVSLLLVQPLRGYYSSNRSEDRLEQTLAVLERHALPGDVALISLRFFVRPLHVPGDVLYLTDHLTPQELDGLLERSSRLWILYTSYLPPVELQEPLDRWVQSRLDEFARVPIKAITALAYHNHVLAEPEAILVDRADLLQDLAQVSADRQEAWLRYSALADTFESLGDLHASRGEATIAAEYRLRAEDARAVAPRPW